MRIHRIRGRNLQEALLRARREHGEKAVVVAQEPEEGGAVTLVVSEPGPALELSAQRAESAPDARAVRFEREVARRLRQQGASPAFIERVERELIRLAALPERADTHPIDLAAEAIGGLFGVARSPRLRGATRTIALVGAPGSGKTTVLGKLALRMARAGRRAAIATLDTHRRASVESLRATANLCGLPFFPLHGAPDFARADLRDGGFEALLVDTTGRARFDRQALARLASSLGSRGAERSELLLVLPATSNRSALARTHESFAPLGLTGCVIGRLDETSEPLGALEQALEGALAPAFLARDPRLASGLRRANAALLADLCLRGRVA